MKETFALTIFKNGFNDQLENTWARTSSLPEAVSLAQELGNTETHHSN